MSYHPYPKHDPIKNCLPLLSELCSLGLHLRAIAVCGCLLCREK